MAVVIGGPVVWNAQALADNVKKLFPTLSHISTYGGHDPDQQHGLDIFPANPTQGDQIAEWLIENVERFGGDYFIWWQRIRNPPERDYWRDMADRGGVTQNHKDHLHISFFDLVIKETFMALTEKEQEDLYEFCKSAAANGAATNAAVARIETAVRDTTSGLQTQVTELKEALTKLANSLGK